MVVAGKVKTFQGKWGAANFVYGQARTNVWACIGFGVGIDVMVQDEKIWK